MIGYTLVGTNDLERAKGYYDALFGSLGIGRIMEMDRMCAWGPNHEVPMFGVIIPFDGNPATVGNGVMISLPMDSRAKIDGLHAKALALNSKDEGAPGVRGGEGDQAFYAAYFRDLDGNKICAFRIGA